MITAKTTDDDGHERAFSKKLDKLLCETPNLPYHEDLLANFRVKIIIKHPEFQRTKELERRSSNIYASRAS